MSDENIIKVMQSLDLNYKPAIDSTLQLQKVIGDLNKQLEILKTNAMQSANSTNTLFSSQLGSANAKSIIDQWGKPIKSIKEEARLAQVPIQELGNTLDRTGNEVDKAGNKFTSNVAKFYAVTKVAKEITGTIKEVEMGMIELQRVMEDSSFVFEKYRDNLFQLGVDYGQTFDNVQSIALRWAQSGYNVAESLELTETSLLALNTAELDATNATESMIGIMAQWGLQADELALVMDKVNVTADNYAVTSQDLVDGLLRSSGAAKVMGMSLDDTIATLTVLRETTGRTGKEVGNALSSILSYIQRPKSIDVMEALGIRMFVDEAKTEFRNVMEVFGELSEKWNDPSITNGAKDALMAGAQEAGLFAEELAGAVGMQEEFIEMTEKATEAQAEFNDIEKRDAAQAAAGVYRRNYFIGLLEKFSSTQEVLNGLVDAGGYSLAENAKTMEALEKKSQSLKTSMEALAVSIGDAGLTDVLKGLADGGTSAINTLNEMPKGMRDLVLATTTTFTAMKTLEWGMKAFGIQIPGISQVIGSLTSGTWSLTSAFKAGATGVSAFVKANAPLLALSATIGAIVAVTNDVKKQREENERAIEVFNQQKESYSEISNLVSTYESLASQSSLATEEQEKLAQVKQKIIDLLPESKNFIDNENLSLAEQIEIVDKLNDAELERLRLNAQKVLNKGEKSYEADKAELEKLIELNKTFNEQLIEYSTKQSDGTATKGEIQALKVITKAIEDTTDKINTLTTETQAYESSKKVMTDIVNGDTDALKANSDSIEENGEKTKSTVKDMETLTKAFDDSSAKLIRYHAILDEVNSKKGLSAKSTQEIISKHQELLPYLSDEGELRKQLIKIIEDEEKTQKKAYASMIMDSESFFNTKVKGNHELIKKLEEYYNIDLKNAKSLAHAKEMVENELIKNLSGKWAKYYGALTTGHNQKLEDGLVRSAMAGNSEANEVLKAVQLYKDAQNRFENIAIDLGGVDFKGINMSGIKDSKDPKSKKDPKYENKALEESLKLLEHRKRISEESQDSIRAELAELNKINNLYVKTSEERMAMAERIYSTEKRLRDRTLQDSVDWISKKKDFDELSVEEEIKAWERVKNNQVNNIEAVKQATLNLYKLREQLRNDNFNKEENTIKHLAKLGVMGIQDQINSLKDLYQTNVTSLEDERNRVENLFGLYKSLLKEQEQNLKDAHTNNTKRIESDSKQRIEAIEKESKLKQDAQNSIIEGIEKELELLNKQEQEYDHDKKMADLREQLAYWEARTSEDARKKVIDLKKQIDEANHKREVDLQKEALNEKKQNAQDEIRNEEDKSKQKIKEIQETTRKEIELAEEAYKKIEIAFDDHSIDMIALASTMSTGMFEEFQKNYLIPLQNALKDKDYGSIGGIMSGIDDFANSQSSGFNNYGKTHDWGMSDEDYKTFIANGKRWEQLKSQNGGAGLDAEMRKLNADNDAIRKKYGRNPSLGEYPEFHQGAKTLSYGMAMFKPGELVFPPDLSIKMEGLISALYQKPTSTSSTSTTDNRRQVNIENLVKVENMHMEDDVDERSFSREIQRQLAIVV